MTKRPWTTKELKTLHEMRAAGRPHAEVAEALGRTVHAVKNMYERTATAPLVGNRIVGEEKDAILQAKAAGWSCNTISLAVGRHPRSVQKFLARQS